MAARLGDNRKHADLGAPASSSRFCFRAVRPVGGAACWLHVHAADARCKNRPDSEYQDRNRTRAHKAYLLALRSLAQVRKLALPMLQVNIAGKQKVVNNQAP